MPTQARTESTTAAQPPGQPVGHAFDQAEGRGEALDRDRGGVWQDIVSAPVDDDVHVGRVEESRVGGGLVEAVGIQGPKRDLHVGAAAVRPSRR